MPPRTHFHQPESGKSVIFFGNGAPPPPDTTIRNQSIRPGVFSIGHSMHMGWYLQPTVLRRDGLIDLPESTSSMVLQEIDNFFTKEVKARYAKYNFLYRRGIMMYGDPGTGKSATVYKIVDRVVEKGGIVLWNCAAEHIAPVVNQIHQIQSDVQVLVVWEEFERYRHDSDVLQLLDGGKQLNNVVYLATTNYIDKIPKRLRNRPSRFARLIEVGPPSAEARKVFLEKRIHPDDVASIDLDAIVEATDGWVIDHLTEFIRSHFVIGQSVDEALSNIRIMNDLRPPKVDDGTGGYDEEED